MDTYDSSGYLVDNRYSGMGRASDNTKAKDFLDRYSRKPGKNLTAERQEDNKFVVSAPGWGSNVQFKNAFGSPRSPQQRRLNNLNQ